MTTESLFLGFNSLLGYNSLMVETEVVMRNVVARDLASPKYRKRVVRSKKLYSRKRKENV